METPTSSIVTAGDLGGQKVAMTMDENALAHLMSILTDLYSDRELAVIREYSTNALDAHIEIGNTDPIQVSTPSAMSPYLVIKDNGVGLSVDDITNMYSKYGASTKRGSNAQVGMLGIGAKSALALVPQFTLISVKNGVKAFVSISRNDEGAGQMEIIDTVSTDEPSGVEIKIPVPRTHDFARKCREFFRFWKPGTVLVDGKEPEYITGRPVGDKFIVQKSLQQDYVVMGNVAYPCNEPLYSGSYNHIGVVAFVNIGDVNFTPSREDLQYTPKTKATLANLKREFSEKLVESINEDIADSATPAEAWKKAREWKASFYNRLNGLVYKGEPIPNDVPINDGKEFYITSRNGRYANWLRGVTPEYLGTHIFVTGFADSMKISPVQREKVAQYCDNIGKSFTKVVITKEPTFVKNPDLAKWMADFTVVPWADIAKIKIQRNKATNKVIRTDPYDLYDGNYATKQVSTLDTSRPIIYFSSAELRYPSWMVSFFGKDAQLIMINRNRWEKFERDWPTAKHYEKAAVEMQKKYVSQMTEADRILWHHSGYAYHVRGLDASRIDDPDVKLFVEVLSDPNRDYSDAAKELRNLMRRDVPTPEVAIPNNPLTKYPLLGNMRETNNEHLYWYLNTYFAELSKEDN